MDAEKIVTVALELLDREGFEGLTMRALAKRLRVENPALYWHFKNKQAIVDAMANRLLARSVVPRKPRESWDRWLRRSIGAFRAALLSHRDATRVVAEADLSQSKWVEAHAAARAELEREGFSKKDALLALVTLSDFTLGATWEQEADPRHQRKGRDAMFFAGVELILSGLRRRRLG